METPPTVRMLKLPSVEPVQVAIDEAREGRPEKVIKQLGEEGLANVYDSHQEKNLELARTAFHISPSSA